MLKVSINDLKYFSIHLLVSLNSILRLQEMLTEDISHLCLLSYGCIYCNTFQLFCRSQRFVLFQHYQEFLLNHLQQHF